MNDKRAWNSYLKPVTIVAISWTLFQLYVVIYGFTDPMILYPVHTCFGIALGILTKPLSRDNMFLKTIDYIAVILIGGVVFYMFYYFERITTRVAFVEPLEPSDFVAGIVVIALLIEVSRRTLGYAMTIIGVLSVIYAFWGSQLPGLLGHRGISLEGFIELEAFTPNGMYGIPVGVSAGLVFYFILFGNFLAYGGGGALFNDLGILVTGRFRGGAAKMTVISSGLYGTISGSAVANVVVDGIYTIPLMKKTGFRAPVAAATEAMASTGGQLMPPIMGAAAFIMAEILGISYWKVAIAAIIPAILYYVAAYAYIDFYAMREGLRGLAKDEMPDVMTGVRRRIHLLFPLGLMIYYIATLSTTPVTAAVRATIAVVIISFLRRETWMGPRKILDAMENTAKEAITIAIPCAMAGLLIGVVIFTGLGLKLTDILISFSGGILLVALVMVMIAVIILGMGMPTSAAYLIAAILMAPVLIKLGVIPLAAHMFIFYFAVISMITPPVALASYAAASLGEADLWETGIQAFKMALSGFLIPFVLVYDPSLILEGSVGDIIWRTFITTIGVVSLSAAEVGLFLRKTRSWERIILFIGALLLIVPEMVTDFIGLFAIGIIAANQLRRPSDLKRKESFIRLL